jgi:sulfur carrier protein ThiS
MLTITVNGREEKLNIGCRTFIALDKLLRILAVDDSAVTLNGTKISDSSLAKTIVKGGDSLKLPGLVRYV